MANFKAIVKGNMIKNLPISVEDIERAEKIYGPDIYALKGKTTRKSPKPVVNDTITIPKELLEKNYQVELCMDVIYVCGIPFLASIDKQVKYRSVVYLESKHSEDFYKALDMILRKYNKAGFVVNLIHCDREFKPLMNEVIDNMEKVVMNYANSLDHVPEIERHNRTLKERFRAKYHLLPYKNLPKTLVKYLVFEECRALNFFSAKGGISKEYSPMTLIENRNLDYKKHCLYPFGAFVQARDEPNPLNTMASHSLDCIYLRPVLDNVQGGHEVFNLQTKRVITRLHVTEIPVPQRIIKLVEELATQDKIKSFKFVLHSITGVDSML